MMAETKDDIVCEAHARFKRCMDFEGEFRQLYVDDVKFCEADADNGYQWPNDLRKNREIDARPCLTINKTRQHVLLITNEAKQNKPSVKVQATGGSASYESAQVFEGVVRHIEYISSASDAYDTALDHQVKGGIGYWRVVTDYIGEDSFDQDIFIRRVKNPLNVLIDPDCNEADRSDAKYGFIFDDMPRDEFERQFPKFKDLIGTAALEAGASWLGKDHVRIAEYYRCEYVKDELIALPMPNPADPMGQPVIQMIKASQLDAEALKLIRSDPTIQRRSIERKEWKWYKIAANQIIDEQRWPGIYLPIVAAVGEEDLIEGKLERKGHVRNLKDPQRMYNYWTSSATEQVALQGKTPWVGPNQAFEGYEGYWDTANTVNHAWIPYNHVDEQGQPIPPPQRQDPPVMASAYINGMQIAAEEMKMASGQYDPAQGNNPMDQSGVALRMQNRRADSATYHYADNLAKAVRYTGKILIDLIPKIYDTPRIIRILAEDGTDEEVTIDPGMQKPMAEQEGPGETVRKIFNPAVGQYDVIADTGPSYATRRDEAFESMGVMLQQQPQFMSVFGDLFFRSANFPLAEEIAERVMKTIPPEIRGEAPPPELLQAQQAMQAMQSQLSEALKALADAQREQDDKAEANAINGYKAVTERLDKMLSALEKNPNAGLFIDGLTAQTAGVAAADPDPLLNQPAPMGAPLQ